MEVIQENPVIIATSWESKENKKECNLLSAILKDGVPTILCTRVDVTNEEDSDKIREIILRDRLQEHKEYIEYYGKNTNKETA